VEGLRSEGLLEIVIKTGANAGPLGGETRKRDRPRTYRNEGVDNVWLGQGNRTAAKQDKGHGN